MARGLSVMGRGPARLLAAGLVAALLAGPAHAMVQPPGMADFETGDGAYVTTVGGDLVDPYFVNKTFIVLLQARVDVRPALDRWLAWLLPRQRADGGFDRYCRADDRDWTACQKADADDATAATTLELLHRAMRGGLVSDRVKPELAAAVRGSEAMLARLKNPQTGIYQVFVDTPTYYLMDNVEVYTALVASGRSKAADALAQAIRQQFDQAGTWQPAWPRFDQPSFYPHALARSFLWVPGLFTTPAEAGADMASWMAQYGDRWRRRMDDHFAWGLVAWNLHQLAPIEAACWRHSVRPYSSAIGWTVLDAGVDAALQHSGIGVGCPR